MLQTTRDTPDQTRAQNWEWLERNGKLRAELNDLYVFI